MVSDLKASESSSSRSHGDFMDIFLLIDLSKAVFGPESRALEEEKKELRVLYL